MLMMERLKYAARCVWQVALQATASLSCGSLAVERTMGKLLSTYTQLQLTT